MPRRHAQLALGIGRGEEKVFICLPVDKCSAVSAERQQETGKQTVQVIAKPCAFGEVTNDGSAAAQA